MTADDFQKLVPGQHQFRHHGHQVLERIDRHTNGLVGNGRAAAGFLVAVGLGLARTLRGSLFLDRRSRSNRSGIFNSLVCDRVQDFRLDFRFAEGTFQFVERNLAGAQRAFQGLIRQNIAGSFLFRRFRFGFRIACGRFARIRIGRHAFHFGNQIAVVALRFLAFRRFEIGKDFLDPVNRRQDDRHGLLRDGSPVTELAHQCLSSVCDAFKSWEPQETACALDRVHKAEDVIKNCRVVRLLLEFDKFNVDNVETFIGLSNKFPEEVVHGLLSPDWLLVPRLVEAAGPLCPCRKGEAKQLRYAEAQKEFFFLYSIFSWRP